VERDIELSTFSRLKSKIEMDNKFSASLRVTTLNDFLRPEASCTKPTVVTRDNVEESNGMVIEYENHNESMMVEAPQTVAKISLADCLACSGCITSSEVVFLESQSVAAFSKQFIHNQSKTVVVSLNLQSMSSLAVHFNITPEQTFAKLRTFFRSLGVNYVFTLAPMRDISLIEVAKEFVERRIRSIEGDSSALPMLLGYCPGWVCYAEKTGDESVLSHISTAKSSQQLMGNYLKTSFAEQLGIAPDTVYHLSIAQCYDKKLEAVRDSIQTNPSRTDTIAEVDIVLSTTEVVDLINEHNVNFLEIPESNEQGPLSEFTRISDGYFGPSHGFTDLVLKVAAREFWGVDVDINNIPFKRGKNNEIWETEFSVNGTVVLRIARAYGFRNIQNIMRSVKRRNCQYDFVELLACPGGCTNGGGQIKASPNENAKDLLAKVNEAFNSAAVRDPFMNPFVAEFYSNIISPESKIRKKQLHTSYKMLQLASNSSLSSNVISW
jgi:iron only hydrogenase large subunit-like protein